jgi:hypothetical protein
MKDEVSFQDYPSYTERSGRKKPVVAFFVVILIIAAVIAGLFFLGRSQSDQEETAVVPTKSLVPTEEPTSTPTPTPDLDRADLRISVLNGSGTAGVAGDIADILRELGYTIGTTGNADNFDYEGIVVNISEEDEEFLDLLKADLEEATDKTVTASVAAGLTSGAQVIVGQ